MAKKAKKSPGIPSSLKSSKTSKTSKTQKIRNPDEYDSSRPLSRFDTERLNRFIAQLIKSNEVKSVDELNQLIEEVLKNKTLDELLDSIEFNAKEKAQDLAYAALETRDKKEALRLANEALKLDPDCIDALVLKTIIQAKSPSEIIETLKEIIAKAEKNFGTEYFKENKGDFWGLVETRPYMRALQTLIIILRAEGRLGESIFVAEKMLKLNQNDNQGIRYFLLGLYLETGNLDGARRLFKEFPESSAVFNWGEILERYLVGDIKKAKKLLKEAMSQNPYVLDYLIGKKEIPQEEIEYYSSGEESEAIMCWQEIGIAWEEYPDALKWLRSFAKEADR